MSWARIDDAFGTHPKVEPLSDKAFRLHVIALCHCNRNLTDGALSESAVRALSAAIKATRRHVDELVQADLWDKEQSGWSIHDFLEMNKSAAEVKEKRAEAKERMRRHRSSRERSDEHDGERSRNVLDGIGSNSKKNTAALDDVRAVYGYWREKRGKTRSNYDTISEARRNKIKSRLREFSVDDLKAAVDGVANDPWSERSLHDDITVIFRSREQVEKFLELAGKKPQPTGKVTAEERARQWVKTVGWQYPDSDLWEELGKFGLEGEEKKRLAALALDLQMADVA